MKRVEERRGVASGKGRQGGRKPKAESRNAKESRQVKKAATLAYSLPWLGLSTSLKASALHSLEMRPLEFTTISINHSRIIIAKEAQFPDNVTKLFPSTLRWQNLHNQRQTVRTSRHVLQADRLCQVFPLVRPDAAAPEVQGADAALRAQEERRRR